MNEVEKAIERYEKIIRRFTTCDLLEYFAAMSIKSYQTDKKGFTIVDFPYYNKKTGGNVNVNKGMYKILNIRNRLYYKRQKLDNESEKDSVTKEIIDITSALTKVRKEIKLCDEIYDKAPKMKEEIREVDEKEKESKLKKIKGMIGRSWYRNVSASSVICVLK